MCVLCVLGSSLAALLYSVSRTHYAAGVIVVALSLLAAVNTSGVREVGLALHWAADATLRGTVVRSILDP